MPSKQIDKVCASNPHRRTLDAETAGIQHLGSLSRVEARLFVSSPQSGFGTSGFSEVLAPVSSSTVGPCILSIELLGALLLQGSAVQSKLRASNFDTNASGGHANRQAEVAALLQLQSAIIRCCTSYLYLALTCLSIPGYQYEATATFFSGRS